MNQKMEEKMKLVRREGSIRTFCIMLLTVLVVIAMTACGPSPKGSDSDTDSDQSSVTAGSSLSVDSGGGDLDSDQVVNSENEKELEAMECNTGSIEIGSNDFTYINARYGFRITLPDTFRIDMEPANGDGAVFKDAGTGMTVTPTGMLNINGQDPEQVAEGYWNGTESEEYEVTKDGFTIRQYDNAQGIVQYYVGWVGPNAINVATIEYPAEKGDQLQDVAESIGLSFEAGKLN